MAVNCLDQEKKGEDAHPRVIQKRIEKLVKQCRPISSGCNQPHHPWCQLANLAISYPAAALMLMTDGLAKSDDDGRKAGTLVLKLLRGRKLKGNGETETPFASSPWAMLVMMSKVCARSQGSINLDRWAQPGDGGDRIHEAVLQQFELSAKGTADGVSDWAGVRSL